MSDTILAPARLAPTCQVPMGQATGVLAVANGGTGLSTLVDYLAAANNLSEITNVVAARTNLGLGSAATTSASAYDTAGSAASVQGNLTSAIASSAATYVSKANNLSDLTSISTAKTNLGAGSANGLATLDGSGKLTSAQVPASLVGAVVYQGTWNATTNTPTLTSGTGTKGNYYKVATAGTTTIDGINSWNAGDTIIFDGSTWDKIDGITNEMISVFGRRVLHLPQAVTHTVT